MTVDFSRPRAEALEGETAVLCLKRVEKVFKSSTFNLWEFVLGSVSCLGLGQRERERQRERQGEREGERESGGSLGDRRGD